MAGVAQNRSGNADWRYEDKLVNSVRSRNMIARIMVAKCSASTPPADLAQYICQVVQGIEIVQDDSNWTCRNWVEQALGATGGEFAVIPEVTNGGEIESRIKAFGDKAMDKLVKGDWDIQHARDLPQTDMRAP